MDERMWAAPTVRRVWWAAMAVAMSLAVACGGGGKSTGARPPSAVPRLPPLLSYVPADAGLVVYVAPGMAELFARFVTGDLQQELRDDAATDDREGNRLAGNVRRQMAAGDGAIARTLGWRPGTSELVAWAQADTLVVRARLDGAALRASLERAEAESGERLPRRTEGGHTYASWIDEGRELLVRLTDDELVLVWTDAAGGGLARLVNDAPATPAFQTERVVTSIFPGRSDAHFGMMFDPAWLVALAEGKWDDDEATCGRAASQLLSRLPPVSYAWARSATDTEVAIAVELSPATAARLDRGLGPMPRWPIDDRYATMGVGLRVATATEVVLPWLDEVERAAGACGRTVALAPTVRMLAAMPLVAQVERLSMVLEPREEKLAIAMTPSAIGSYWAAMRAFVPLRSQPPAIGERLETDDAVLTTDGTSLFATEPGSEPLLDLLQAGRPGPRAIVAVVLPDRVLAQFTEDDEDESSRLLFSWVARMSMELGLHGRHLTWRWSFLHRR